jgi:phosphate uptake regulator
MDTFEQMKNLITSMQADVDKTFENGNKAAAKRVRKGAQEIKNLCGELRKEALEETR